METETREIFQAWLEYGKEGIDGFKAWLARLETLEEAIAVETDNQRGMGLLKQWGNTLCEVEDALDCIEARSRKKRTISLRGVRELRRGIGSRLTEKALKLGGLTIEQPSGNTRAIDDRLSRRT